VREHGRACGHRGHEHLEEHIIPTAKRPYHFQGLRYAEDVEAEHLADIHKLEISKLVTGKAKKSWVHVVDPTDDGMENRWTLNCSTRLWRATATLATLRKMQDTGKPFCPTCIRLWPHHIKNSLNMATKASLKNK
jgi:hypothetical protein